MHEQSRAAIISPVGHRHGRSLVKGRKLITTRHDAYYFTAQPLNSRYRYTELANTRGITTYADAPKRDAAAPMRVPPR